jgi:hypothetical protein
MVIYNDPCRMYVDACVYTETMLTGKSLPLVISRKNREEYISLGQDMGKSEVWFRIRIVYLGEQSGGEGCI